MCFSPSVPSPPKGRGGGGRGCGGGCSSLLPQTQTQRLMIMSAIQRLLLFCFNHFWSENKKAEDEKSSSVHLADQRLECVYQRNAILRDVEMIHRDVFG